MKEALKAGLVYEEKREVQREHTAVVFGSGKLEVFATPCMIAWMEHAAMHCVGPLLEEGMDTVGVKVEVAHEAATPVGMEVRVRAELKNVEGRKLTFEVSAYDEKERIGQGMHERFIVSREKFLSKALRK